MTNPDPKNALLNGASRAAVEIANDQMSNMRNQPPPISIPAGQEILIVFETASHLEDLLLAVAEARAISDLPVVASMTFGEELAAVDGTTPEVAARALAAAGVDALGVNCGVGPVAALDALAQMVPDAAGVPLLIMPNAGLPTRVEGQFVYAAGPAYFVHDLDRVRLVCLDTVNPHGGWQGSLDREQFDWLARVLDESADRYVVVASHHPSPTLVNDYVPAGTSPRVLGPEVVDLLLASRSVVAWIAGHVHVHAAQYRGDEQRGFWEITTSSLIDWPQQVRLLELLRVDDGAGPQIALVSTVVDHASPSGMGAGFWADGPDLSDPALLAGLSRELSANDYRMRERPLRGLTLDSSAAVRNVTWRSPDPLSR